jgi:hypothetical protein
MKEKYDIPRRKENTEFRRGVGMIGTPAYRQAGLSGRGDGGELVIH